MADSASSHLASSRTLPIRAKRHPLVAEVRHRLLRHTTLRGRPNIIVGVSGGADSVALVAALLAIGEQKSSKIQPRVIVAHVNHHLRESAALDEAFVRSLAQRLDLPIEVREVQPAASDGNLPARARELRYAALASVAREHRADAVAVAHHAEDQFETMLMSLCRGCGLDGLSAMTWSRPMHTEAVDAQLIRPLLGSRKEECMSLCEAAGLEWQDDPSNLDLSRNRNRLRHEVVPILEACWPGAAVRGAMTADLVREASVLIESALAVSFGCASIRLWPRESLASLPPALVAAGVRRAANHALHQPDSDEPVPLSSRQLTASAEAITDDSRLPRQFALTSGLTLHVRSREVELEVC